MTDRNGISLGSRRGSCLALLSLPGSPALEHALHVERYPLSLCSPSVYVSLEARFYWLSHHSTLGTPVTQSTYQIILGAINFLTCLV